MARRVFCLHCNNVKVNFCDNGDDNDTENGNIYLQEEEERRPTPVQPGEDEGDDDDDNLAITVEPFIVHSSFLGVTH